MIKRTVRPFDEKMGETAVCLLLEFGTQVAEHFGLKESVVERALLGTSLCLKEYRDIFGGVLVGFTDLELTHVLFGVVPKNPLVREGQKKIRKLIRIIDKFLDEFDLKVLRRNPDLVEYSGSTVLAMLVSELDRIVIYPTGDQENTIVVKRTILSTCAQHGLVPFLRYCTEGIKLDAEVITECLQVAMRYSQLEVIRHFLSIDTLNTHQLMMDNLVCDIEMLYPREVWKMVELTREYPDSNFVHLSIRNLGRGRISKEWIEKCPDIEILFNDFLSGNYDAAYFGNVESYHHFASLLPDQLVLKHLQGKKEHSGYIDHFVASLFATTHPHLFQRRVRVSYYERMFGWVHPDLFPYQELVSTPEQIRELAGRFEDLKIEFLE